MQTRWIIAIVATAAVGLVGGGVGIGWQLWGAGIQPRNSRIDQLEETAGNLTKQLDRNRAALADARAVSERLEQRNRDLTTVVQRSEDRQRAVDDAIGRAAERLSEAGDGARSITALARRNVEILDELLTTIGGGDPEGMEGQPP